MSIEPTDRAATDQATNNPAPLVPTDTTNTATTGHVTAQEIAEFLRHLAQLRGQSRGEDPGQRAAFLARKADLFARIAATPPACAAPERSTP